MINARMRIYDYFTFGNNNSYGQPQISSIPTGQVKMAISLSSQGVQDNVNYKQAQYVGLTFDDVNDRMVIDYEGARLKVLYVNTHGRYNQVFMSAI